MSDDLVMRARAYVVHVEGVPVNLGDRIEELQKERDAYSTGLSDASQARDALMWEAQAEKDRADALAALLREAEEALRPFATALERYGFHEQECVVLCREGQPPARMNILHHSSFTRARDLFARLEAREVSQ